jgi:hypothetical protein
MKHNRSEVESLSKIYQFFHDELKGFYIQPNEYNVHTNRSGPGSSAQKYDPREDLYIRFPKAKKFDPKIKYGMAQDKNSLVGKCAPEFIQINQNEEMKFTKMMSSKSVIRKKRQKVFEYQEPQYFTFLSLTHYYSSLFYNRDAILSRYRLFRNTCSKAVSVLLNFCLIDPRYDLQFEDMFFKEDGTEAYSKVYCKKSQDKDWSLIREETYKLE